MRLPSLVLETSAYAISPPERRKIDSDINLCDSKDDVPRYRDLQSKRRSGEDNHLCQFVGVFGVAWEKGVACGF